MINVLMVGDIVGRPGRNSLKYFLSPLQKKYNLDLVIVNGENSAGGNGITEDICEELYDLGVSVITMGNHTWDKKEIFSFIDFEQRLIRPYNYPPGTPGKGSTIIRLDNGCKVGVVNLSGRIFLSPLDCPFRCGEEIVNRLRKETPIIIIDFHAEATSEKIAFGWFMDGKVSAVIGTHTHVQTADERILPQGCAYITDVGMTGPRDSVLGVKKEIVVNKFITQLPARFEVASGAFQFNGVLIKINKKNGKAEHIERIFEYTE